MAPTTATAAFQLLRLDRESATAADAKRAYHRHVFRIYASSIESTRVSLRCPVCLLFCLLRRGSRALKWAHPDKGGDALSFLQVTDALKAVLQDLERRQHSGWDWRSGQGKATKQQQQREHGEDTAAPADTTTRSPEEARVEALRADAVREAETAVAAGDFVLACEKYSAAVCHAPQDASLLLRRAACYTSLGRLDDALADAEKAVACKPRLAQAHAALGAALQRMGRRDDAVAALRRAMELDKKRELPDLAQRLQDAQREAADNACVARLSHGSSLLVALIPLATQCESAFSVAALTRDGVIRVWDSALCDFCSSVAAHEAETAVWACSSPCGTFIATGTSDGLLKLWRVSRVVVDEAESSNLELAHKLEGHTQRITCGCFTADGAHLVTGAADAEARVWLTGDGTCLRTMRCHTKYITCLAMVCMDTGDVLVSTGSGDGTIRVWNLSTGASWDDVDCVDSGAVTHLAWCKRDADAQAVLLSAHFDLKQETSRMLVWDFSVTERTHPLQQFAACFPKKTPYFGRVTALGAVNTDGAESPLAAVATSVGILAVCDPATCKTLFTSSGAHATRSASIHAALLSPSGQYIATAGVDNIVRVWATDEGRQVVAFVGHSSVPTMLLWSRDGRFLLSGGGKDNLRVWDIAPGL